MKTLPLLSALVFAGLLAGPARGAEPPRYQLSVGQEITYDITSREVSPETTQTGHVQDVFRVAAKNADGSWRVLESCLQRNDPAAAPDVGRSRLRIFDLWPDGRVKVEGAAPPGPFTPWPEAFPLLPVDGPAAEAGWTQQNPDGTSMAYRMTAPPKPGTVGFAGIPQSVVNQVYLIGSQSAYVFDPAQGLIASCRSVTSSSYGTPSHGSTLIRLADSRQMAPEAMALFARELTACLAAESGMMKAVQTDHRDPAAMAAAGEALMKARAATTLPDLRPFLDSWIGELASVASSPSSPPVADPDRAAVLDHPAPAWNLPDLAGTKHALADYRGKVVVMDFWYRGCVWCIRSMPALKQLAADYAGQPVVFLGMNTDENPDDAKFVVDTLGLNYTILRTSSQAEPLKYHVQGYPTLFIIDQNGVVRDMDVGYSPTLHADLAAKISALLKP